MNSMLRGYLIVVAFVLGLQLISAGKESRDPRFASLFQVVRFQNGPCVGTSKKNGTCYTQDECSSKGGSMDGSCASGYGVCCTFELSCGGVSSENCTYFESGNVQDGVCQATICPCDANICQLRLDLEIFTITGPSQDTTASTSLILGIPIPVFGTAVVSTVGQCLTDIFSVSNPVGSSPPSICGMNSGEHMYVDAHESCNKLLFRLGQNGAGITNRQWSIKITQYSCNFDNLAPEGCTQYFFGKAIDSIQSFNFAGGKHLSSQNQNICIRRERGNCRICYTAAMNSDFDVSGPTLPMGATGSLCCNYGTFFPMDYDCVMIPGARKATDTLKMAAVAICGRQKGLVTESGGNPQTICTNREPFSLRFRSDLGETEQEKGSSGFKLVYIQNAIGC